MPKAKPISLHPLTFEQVIDTLIRTKPAKKVASDKPKVSKPTSKTQRKA